MGDGIKGATTEMSNNCINRSARTEFLRVLSVPSARPVMQSVSRADALDDIAVDWVREGDCI